MNYPALVVQAGKKIGMESLVLHAFKSTSIPAGKQFNSIIRIRNVDIYCGIYELSSFKKSGDEGIYFTHNAVQPAGWVSKEMLPMIQIIAASLAGKTYAASPDTEEPGATEEV